MQVERHVAGRVREIPADDGADVVPCRGHGRDVEQLARQVVDAAQQDERDRAPQSLELAEDVLRAQRGLACPRSQPHDGARGVVAVVTHLRCDSVRVRGEGGVLDDDAIALGRGPVERRHQEVEVDRQRVHRDDLLDAGAHEPGERSAQPVGRRQPGVGALEPALDGEGRPGIDLRLEAGAAPRGCRPRELPAK